MFLSLTLAALLLAPQAGNGQGNGHLPTHPSSVNHPFHPNHPHHPTHPGHTFPPGHAGHAFGAPEIDANLGRAGFALLAGGALLLLGRRRSVADVPRR